MSNKKGKEVAFTNHPTKQRSKRPSQITCHSQPIAFPSIDSSFRTSHFGSRPLVHGAFNSYSKPNVDQLFRTSQIAYPPLVEGVQSTYSHPPPMDERLNLGSNETFVASKSNDNDVKPILNLDGQGYVLLTVLAEIQEGGELDFKIFFKNYFTF